MVMRGVAEVAGPHRKPATSPEACLPLCMRMGIRMPGSRPPINRAGT